MWWFYWARPAVVVGLADGGWVEALCTVLLCRLTDWQSCCECGLRGWSSHSHCGLSPALGWQMSPSLICKLLPFMLAAEHSFIMCLSLCRSASDSHSSSFLKKKKTSLCLAFWTNFCEPPSLCFSMWFPVCLHLHSYKKEHIKNWVNSGVYIRIANRRTAMSHWRLKSN